MDIMKKFLKKVINKIFSILFQGVSIDNYKGSISHRSFDSMSSALLWMVNGVQSKYPEMSIKDKQVLEIGSGKFLSHPLAIKVLGADKIVSIDLHRQFNQKLAYLSYCQQIMAKKFFSGYIEPVKYLKTMDSIKNTNLDLGKLKKMGIVYLAPLDLHDYHKNESIDLIISYTVLEHVPPRDISGLLNKSVEILKDGGYFCHFIDLEDHKNPNKPFEFLKYDDWSDADCMSRGNRLRLNDWRAIFNDLNVEYEFISILQRSESLLPKGIKKELSNYTSGILVVGRK